MKLQIASDIHREFGHSPELPDVGADVLVLAGDIGTADDEAVVFLTETVKPGDIVITHWPPTLKARHMGIPMDDIARYFNADIPEVVESTRPELWICGHTHYNVDFMFGETRILSNQGGYPHETLTGYDPGLIVEV